MKKSLTLILVLGMLGTGTVACSTSSITSVPAVASIENHAATEARLLTEARFSDLIDPEYAALGVATNKLRLSGGEDQDILTVHNAGTVEKVSHGREGITAPDGQVLHFFELTLKGKWATMETVDDIYLNDFELKVNGEVVEFRELTSGFLIVSAPEDATITLDVFRKMGSDGPYRVSHDYDIRQTIDLRSGERIGSAMEEYYYEPTASLNSSDLHDGSLDNEVLGVHRSPSSAVTGAPGEGKAILTVQTALPPAVHYQGDGIQVPVLTAADGETYSPVHTSTTNTENHGLYYFEVPNTIHDWSFHLDTYAGVPGYVDKPISSSSKVNFVFEPRR